MRITIDSPIKGADAFVFERMSAYEELGRPYRYDLHLLSQNRDLSLSPLLGEAMTVDVEIAEGVSRHFNGYVTRASALGGHGRSARYRVELRPWISLLKHQATCRIWQNTTIFDVLKAVGSKAHFTVNCASQAVMAGREWEYIVQYRESDYNFFMRLLEQEGWWYYFTHEDGKHELYVTDDLSDHQSALENLRFDFRDEGSRHEIAEDVFTGWSVSEQVRSTHYELDDYDFKSARGDLFVRSGQTAKLPKNGGKGASDVEDRELHVFDYPGEYVTPGEGTQLTTVRQQQLRVDRHVVSAQGNIRQLGAGSIFTLSGHPRAGQDGKYAVTSVELNIEAAAVESGLGGEDFVFNGNYRLLHTSLPFRLEQTTDKPVIAGPQTAVVVGPPNEEIHTDDYGRIKVHFRWDRTGQEPGSPGEIPKPEERSCWIRVAQPWASSGFGFQFIPRVGDEVVVHFLEGDPDRPLVTGSVYNSVNKLPYTLPANKTQSGVKTRSSKQGGADNANEIRFEDQKGEEELFVQAERNHTVKVKKDRSLSVGGNESYSVTGTRDTTITKKNTDTYKDEHKMEVTKKVEEIFHAEHVLKVTGKQTIDVTNDVVEHITQNYQLTTDKKFLLTQGGTTMKFEANAVDMKIAAPLTITRGGGKITIDDSGSITMESALGIVLKCGASTIEVTMAGVAVIGPMVKVNA